MDVNAVSIAIGGIMYTTILLIPQFVDAPAATGYGFGASVIQGSLFLLPLVLLMLLVSPAAGYLCGRVGSRAVLILGLSVAAVGFVMLAFVHRRAAEVLIASGTVGAGLALSFSASSLLIVAAVPSTQTSAAAGMNAVMRTTGGAIGNTVAATLLAASTASEASPPTGQAFALAFALGAASCTAGAMVAAMIPTRPVDDTGVSVELGSATRRRPPRMSERTSRPLGPC